MKGHFFLQKLRLSPSSVGSVSNLASVNNRLPLPDTQVLLDRAHERRSQANAVQRDGRDKDTAPTERVQVRGTMSLAPNLVDGILINFM